MPFSSHESSLSLCQFAEEKKIFFLNCVSPIPGGVELVLYLLGRPHDLWKLLFAHIATYFLLEILFMCSG